MDLCAICLEEKQSPTFIRCGHSLCKKCLKKFISHSGSAHARCPLCRTPLNKSSGEAETNQHGELPEPQELETTLEETERTVLELFDTLRERGLSRQEQIAILEELRTSVENAVAEIEEEEN